MNSNDISIFPMERHSHKRDYTENDDKPEDVYNRLPCVEGAIDKRRKRGSNSLLHIVSDVSDDFSAYETIVQPVAYQLYDQRVYQDNHTPIELKYRNPFRELDLSSFPTDLQTRLKQLPFLTQIAILKNPILQVRYFPEYCSVPIPSETNNNMGNSI